VDPRGPIGPWWVLCSRRQGTRHSNCKFYCVSSKVTRARTSLWRWLVVLTNPSSITGLQGTKSHPSPSSSSSLQSTCSRSRSCTSSSLQSTFSSPSSCPNQRPYQLSGVLRDTKYVFCIMWWRNSDSPLDHNSACNVWRDPVSRFIRSKL
jgi:hypothetical protein